MDPNGLAFYGPDGVHSIYDDPYVAPDMNNKNENPTGPNGTVETPKILETSPLEDDISTNSELSEEEKQVSKDIITVEIIRKTKSRYFYKDRKMRRMDTIRFINKTTGDSFELKNCQTVVSNFKKDGNPKTPFGNTIVSNKKITFKFLGYDSKSTRYKGPVFTIQNANTEGLGIIDENGINILDNQDKRPYRLHANYDKNENKVLPMASDGCPMYDYQQIPAFETFLKNSNITTGDILQGIIKEDIIYGP